jgi:dihydrolipoamide dehydrogenase
MSKKVAVIGAGPAGYPASFMLAELGADVTLIEKNRIGGVCLNWGCIPSKSYLDSAHRFEILKSLNNLTEDSTSAIEQIISNASWEKIQNRKNKTIETLQQGLKKTIAAKKINLVLGEASFISNKEISIKTSTNTITQKFDYCIIATGSESFYPAPFNEHKETLLDNKTVFDLKKMPKSISIIGGGVIGVEFACFFSGFDVEVNIIEMMPNILPDEDESIVRVLKRSLDKRGISIHTNTKTKNIKISADTKTIELDNGKILSSEHILIAAGRALNTQELKLENAGIKCNTKAIKVDENFKVVENIYAVGDINGKALLAHAASAQGIYVANHIMECLAFYDNDLVPKCIYTEPEVASIGLNKKQAEKLGKTVKIHRAFFISNGKAQATTQTDGLLQIISDASSKQILGAQIVGQSATEIIHIFSTAIFAKMKTDDLKKIIFAHPTISETITEALSR